MKLVIFSDTHLTDEFDENKYNFLVKVIKSADEVIINGDFWDGYLVSFDKFVNSDYKKLFPLLLEKKTTYLFGNHDKKKFCNKRTNLFSVKTGTKEIRTIGKLTYRIEHGNKISPSLEARLPKSFDNKFLLKLGGMTEEMGVRLIGTRFFDIYKSQNATIKNWIKRRLRRKEILVSGHTHFPEIDLSNRFIDDGCILYGHGQYVFITEAGPRLVKKTY